MALNTVLQMTVASACGRTVSIAAGASIPTSRSWLHPRTPECVRLGRAPRRLNIQAALARGALSVLPTENRVANPAPCNGYCLLLALVPHNQCTLDCITSSGPHLCIRRSRSQVSCDFHCDQETKQTECWQFPNHSFS